MSAHLFPRYHVRPPTGYLNDPNGPIIVNGLVHLYYQHRETLDVASPVRWGHVTSTDLAHWTHHPPALTPHPQLGDRDGCWSGNTIVGDDRRVRAFYSGHVAGEPLQRTLTAMSDDGGYSFGAPRTAVAEPAADENIQVLRDPFVWRNGTTWRMALGAGTNTETAMVRLYTCDDLEAWSYAGPLVQMPRTRTSAWDSGAMWECPQILTLDGVDVAVVGSHAPVEGVMDVLSVVVPPESGSVVIDPSTPHRVDHGPNFYAASVLRDSPHGALMWGWATEGRSARWCEADGWSGMLTLPRIVTLRPDGALACAPPPTLAALRLDAAGHVVSDHMENLDAQFEFLIEPAHGSRSPCTIRLRCGQSEHLDIAVDYGRGRVTIDRNNASDDPRADGGTFTMDGLDDLQSPGSGIRGFVDGSILELFLPGGRVATVRFYPTSPPPWRVELLSDQTTARLSVWKLSG